MATTLCEPGKNEVVLRRRNYPNPNRQRTFRRSWLRLNWNESRSRAPPWSLESGITGPVPPAPAALSEINTMSSPLTASQTLEREYLAMRAKVLELAASLDRIQRSEGDGQSDPRWKKIEQGIRLLLTPEEGRAEQVQLHFSREYSATWRAEFGLQPAR